LCHSCAPPTASQSSPAFHAAHPRWTIHQGSRLRIHVRRLKGREEKKDASLVI
jgi:hypothetical protein